MAFPDRPFVFLLEQDCTGHADCRFPVGKDADDNSPPLYLLVQALQQVCGVNLAPVFNWVSHVCKGIFSGFFQELGHPRVAVFQGLNGFADLQSCRTKVRLSKDCPEYAGNRGNTNSKGVQTLGGML